MIKQVARTMLWLFVGLAGTSGILITMFAGIDKIVPVYLPSLELNIRLWDSFVTAKGTWTIENERSAYPLQTTEIYCSKNEMQCISSHAEIAEGGILFARTHFYKVNRWDEASIIFGDFDPTCVDYNYIIERSSRRVSGTRVTKNMPGLCSIVSSGEINLVLTDGGKVTRQLGSEALEKLSPFAWTGLGLWWAFISFQVWRVWHQRKHEHALTMSRAAPR